MEHPDWPLMLIYCSRSTVEATAKFVLLSLAGTWTCWGIMILDRRVQRSGCLCACRSTCLMTTGVGLYCCCCSWLAGWPAALLL